MKKVCIIFLCFLLFFFWYWIYPNHIYNQEYFSFFENTVDYFWSYAGIPGGLPEWIGCFVSQFYRFLGIGVLLQTLSVVLLFILLAGIRLYRKDTLTEWVWCLVPVSLLFLLQLHYTFLLGNTLQVLCWYAFFFFYSRIADWKIRLGIALLFCFPSVWIFGAAPALLWALTIIIYESLLAPVRRLYWISFPVVLWLSVLSWRFFCLVPHEEWFTMFPRVSEFISPATAWLLYLWLPVCMLPDVLSKVFGFRWSPVHSKRKIGFGVCLLAGVWAWGWNMFYYPPAEHVLRLHRALIREDWKDILDANLGYEGERASVYVLTNLALQHQGLLPERALDYPQIGIAGLIHPRENNYFSNVYSAAVYEALGVTNEAFHWIFEAGVSHKDNPPAHILKKQVELMIKLGKEPAAARYLRRLALVPAYGSWAQEQLQKTSAPEAKRFLALETLSGERQAESRQVTVPERDDFQVGAEGPFVDLFHLAYKFPRNECVRDYLLTGLLLERELGDFYHWFCTYYPENTGYPYKLPRLYCEALMLVALTKIDTAACRKYVVPVGEQDLFRDYLEAYGSYGADKETARIALRERYKSSYWYYLHFR